jgi:C_GCAxxG_C_C family probable redox protein
MMINEMTRQETIEQAILFFDEGYACSQSVLLAFSKQFSLDEQTAKLISSAFGGGMGRLREKCGALTGSFMVLGLAFGNTDPKGMDAKLKAYQKVRELNKKVENEYGTTNCAELLKKFASGSEVAERKHHKIICRKVVGDVTGLLFDLLSHEIPNFSHLKK